jgi:hypothetical protein
MPVIDIPEVEQLSQAQRHTLARRIFVSTIRFLTILALGAAAGGGWYMAKKGFGRQWRALVVEELRKHGVEASVRRLTLDPFRGLVAQDVRIFDYKDRENTIAQISRLSLDVNYAALFQRQPFLNAVDIRNAEVTLPLPANASPNSPRTRIKNLHAHVYFPPEQIYVSQAEGVLCGIEISATGQLIKRKDYQPSRDLTEEEWQARLQTLQRVVAELSRFQIGGARLQIKFSGDMAQLEHARVEATLRAETIQRRKYQARQLAMAAELSDQTLALTQCEWQDELGGVSGSARWQRADGNLEFQARSGLDLRALLDGFGLGETLADVKFLAPPRFDLSGRGMIGQGQPRWQMIGHAALGAFTYKEIPFLGATAEFSWDGTRTLLRDIGVRHQSGDLTAELLEAPNDFRLDLTSTIDANALRSLAPSGLREFVNDWDWPHTSNVQLTIRGPSREPGTWKGDGKLQLERGRFRTIPFNHASADIHFGEGAITYENFRVVRNEGIATGTFVYDFVHHETRLSNVRSTLRPTEAIYWIDPKLLKTVTPYKFETPPTIIANGVYQFRGGKETRLELTVDSPGRMDYVFLGKTLPFERIAAKLLFTSDRLQITQLTGRIFSGDIRGSADILLVRNNERYRADMAIERVEFPRVTELYYGYKTAQGFMSGQYEWVSLGSDARSMNGKGSIEVRNGDIFAIPVFGPLSDLLNKVLPGFGYRVAREATATFTIKNGLIKMPDLHVDAGAFGMVGHGNAQFLDDEIDFDVRVDASGAGVVLTPLYKFFEYGAEGRLSHPTWRAKNF